MKKLMLCLLILVLTGCLVDIDSSRSYDKYKPSMLESCSVITKEGR